MASRRADACPYPRPFDDGFAACPAYREARFLAVDLQYRPLGTLRSCANLQARSLGAGAAGFYPCCVIGDAAARKAWAAAIQADRLGRIRRLSRTLGEATRDASRQMWEAKAEQLRAVRSGRDAQRQTRQVMRAAGRYETAAVGVLDRLGPELEKLEIDRVAILDLLHEAVTEWALRTDGFEGYRPSPEVLQRFPAELRAFLSPNAG